MSPRKSFLCFLLFISTLVANTSCTNSYLTYTPTPNDKLVRITLLQLNDVYQISPVDKGTRGGLARVANKRKKIIEHSPNTLLILAGDTLFPSVASKIFEGRQMIEAWNAIGLDYAVLGNHEFDMGNDILLKRMEESEFTWLGSNVVYKTSKKPFGNMPEYVTVEFDGAKIGIFGILTPDTIKASKPGSDVEFLDPFETAAKLVPKMRKNGANVIIAITHLSMSQDKRLAESAKIDVILGGHEHKPLHSHSAQTPIFKLGSDARNLGRIDLLINAANGKLEGIEWDIIPITDKIPDDPKASAVIKVFEHKLSEELDKDVGHASVELDALQATNRSEETNLGNFIADSYREATDADVAIINSGSIRSNSTYGPGKLTKRDIISILPFENPVVKVIVKGAIIRAALEHGVSRIVEDKEEGRFPQVSGLKFTYDGRRPSGSRIISLTVNGETLDDNRPYELATSNYLIEGGDGYVMFQEVEYLIRPEEGQSEPAIVMTAIGSKDSIRPEIEDRITGLDKPTIN